MRTESSEARQNVQAWIEQLSPEQINAVAPLLQTLDQVLSVYPRPASTPSVTLATVEKEHFTVHQNLSDTLEKHLESCLESLDDPQAVKASISKCLELLRSEKRRFEENGSRPGTRGEMDGDRPILNSYPLPPTADAVTGLPGRLPFQRTISNALTEGKEAVVALFAVERLAYLNKRFGRGAGDDILLFVAQYLAQELPDSSSLSRWSGPAFAALLGPTINLKRSAMQVRAIAAKQLSKSIESDGRTVMLPITCSCMVEELAPGSSPESIFSKMDDFLSAHIND